MGDCSDSPRLLDSFHDVHGILEIVNIWDGTLYEILDVFNRRAVELFLGIEHKFISCHPNVFGFDSVENGSKKVQHFSIDPFVNVARIDEIVIEEVNTFEHTVNSRFILLFDFLSFAS